jgi:hypothetical protein
MSKSWRYRSYRHPRTTQEKRNNQEYDKDYDKEFYSRPLYRMRRNISNLVDAYDDYPHNYEKSWKKTRKVRYYNEEDRVQLHKVEVDWEDMFKLRIYCEDHGIRYRCYAIGPKRFDSRYCFMWWAAKDIGLKFLLNI